MVAVLGAIILTTLGSCASRLDNWKVLLDRLRTDAAVPGAVLFVRLPDGKQIAVASGETELTGGHPVTTGSCFYIGSITKTLTMVVCQCPTPRPRQSPTPIAPLS